MGEGNFLKARVNRERMGDAMTYTVVGMHPDGGDSLYSRSFVDWIETDSPEEAAQGVQERRSSGVDIISVFEGRLRDLYQPDEETEQAEQGEGHRGTIAGFRGTWGSGIAQLDLEDGRSIPCENAPTVRALAAAFPDVIGPGHTVNVEALKGIEIEYWYDDLGLMLGGFRPVDPVVSET